MERILLKSKIHRATITEADLHYEGSMAIDLNLLEAANIVPYEMVRVYNINNGARFETYAIEAPRGSGTISLNGAAARMGHRGDLVIVTTFVNVKEEEVAKHRPVLVFVGEGNGIGEITREPEEPCRVRSVG